MRRAVPLMLDRVWSMSSDFRSESPNKLLAPTGEHPIPKVGPASRAGPLNFMVPLGSRHLPRRTLRLLGLFFAGIMLGQTYLCLQRFRRRFRAGLGIKSKEIPFFLLVALLAHVPLILVIARQGKECAGGRLVTIRIALGRAELVQHAA